MEKLIKGAKIKDFYCMIRYENTVFVAQRKSNGYGRYLELSEYGRGGRRSFIVFPEGNEGRGWAECATQLRKVQNFFVWSESTARIGEKANGSAIPVKPRPVEEDNRTFAEVLTGKGHEKELEILSGDILSKARITR